MKKTKALILAVFTCLPIVYIILFFSFIITTFASISKNEKTSAVFGMFNIIFPLHIITMVLMITLLVIYIKDVFSNENISTDRKSLWAIVLFFGNIIAMPVYWYLNIWKPLKDEEKKKI